MRKKLLKRALAQISSLSARVDQITVASALSLEAQRKNDNLREDAARARAAEAEAMDKVFSHGTSLIAWERELSKVMPPDFKKWTNAASNIRPIVARGRIEALEAEIKALQAEIVALKEEKPGTNPNP